jgi:glycosyltransferase involved in cell wall biosynthesis
MISVIVATLNSAAGLQTLLPPLVPAAVDGLVREVIAADGGSTDATLEICEDAGVTVVAGGIVAAAAGARSDLVLIVPDDLMLRPGWDERLRAHLVRGREGAVLVGERGPGFMGRFTAPKLGLLVDRAKLAGRPETRDVAALARALGRGAKRL